MNTPQVIAELNSLYERKEAAVLGASWKVLGLDLAAVDLNAMPREKRADLDERARRTSIGGAQCLVGKEKNFKELTASATNSPPWGWCSRIEGRHDLELAR